MSVQDIVEAYETRLRERWTPDGEQLPDPSNLYVMVTPDGKQVSKPFDITKPMVIPLDMEVVDRISDLSQEPFVDPIARDWGTPEEDRAWQHLQNTREICGND